MDDLPALAYKSERAASRKLARRLGISEQDALLQSLTLAAGAQGLGAMLARRRAMREADAQRAAARLQRHAQAAAQRALRRAGQPAAWRGWFDGSARPNPGRCSVGALVLGPDGERIEIARDAGHGNSSEAEYRALIALLEAALAAGATELTACGDSKVVIDDMNGAAAAAPALAALRAIAGALAARLDLFDLRWVPRHRNLEADLLSQRSALAGAHD